MGLRKRAGHEPEILLRLKVALAAGESEGGVPVQDENHLRSDGIESSGRWGGGRRIVRALNTQLAFGLANCPPTDEEKSDRPVFRPRNRFAPGMVDAA